MHSQVHKVNGSHIKSIIQNPHLPLYFYLSMHWSGRQYIHFHIIKQIELTTGSQYFVFWKNGGNFVWAAFNSTKWNPRVSIRVNKNYLVLAWFHGPSIMWLNLLWTSRVRAGYKQNVIQMPCDTLQRRQNGHYDVSNHQPHDCVYLTVYSGANQRKHQSSASPAFDRWIYRTNGQ